MGGNDSLLGGLGHDNLIGGEGADSINGGAGIDTAVFSGNAAAYSKVFGSLTVTDNNTGDGDDGSDSLTNVEILQFADAKTYVVGNGSELSLQAAIDAAVAGETILIANGTYTLTSTLNVNKGVILLGESEAGVTIDASGVDSYGILLTGNNAVLKNFTLLGPQAGMTPNDNYGIKAQPDSGVSSDTLNGITIENVTVKGSLTTEIDLNGVNGALIKNVTADGLGTSGAGIGLDASANITFENVATTGNTWGSTAIYLANNYYALQTANITFNGTFSHGEPLGISVDNDGSNAGMGTLTLPTGYANNHGYQVKFGVGSTTTWTGYFASEAEADAFLAVLTAPQKAFAALETPKRQLDRQTRHVHPGGHQCRRRGRRNQCARRDLHRDRNGEQGCQHPRCQRRYCARRNARSRIQPHRRI
jgi:hypothetical protein